MSNWLEFHLPRVSQHILDSIHDRLQNSEFVSYVDGLDLAQIQRCIVHAAASNSLPADGRLGKPEQQGRLTHNLNVAAAFAIMAAARSRAGDFDLEMADIAFYVETPPPEE